MVIVMIKNNIKRIIIFLALLVILVGVVSAENTTDHTNTQDKIVKEKTTTTSTVNIESIQKEAKINKNNKTTKSSTGTTYTTSVSNYQQLADKIEDAKNNNYDTYTINLNKGNYNATTSMTYDKQYQPLVINANGITLDGQQKYQFLSIESGATFTLNNAILQNFKATGGGAIFGDDDTTITITKTTFKNNQAEANGGAIYTHNKLTITDSEFTANTATGYGGAIHSYYGKISITNTQFQNNKVLNESGGAIGNFYGNINIDKTVLNNNKASQEGGSLYSSEGNIKITNTNITNNECNDYGGGISTEKGTLILENNNFISNKNTDSYGGAVSSYKDKFNATNNQFTKNHAEWRGGAIYSFKSETKLHRNNYTTNTAYNGGALVNEKGIVNVRYSNFIKNIADSDGGAIDNLYGELIVTNSLFTENNAIFGGAIENIGGVYSYSRTTYDAWGRPDQTTYYKDMYGNMLIAENNFTNNYAETGGAIGNYVPVQEGLPPSDVETSNDGVQINHNKFHQNRAEEGGAICVEEANNTYIMNNTFTENTAPEGGAIKVNEKCEEDINIAYNTFTKNTAVNGSAINTKGSDVFIIENLFVQNKMINSTDKSSNAFTIINESRALIKNNTNDTRTSYPGQIYDDGFTRIEDNIINDNKTQTKITLTVPTNNVIQNNPITIKGKLTTNGKVITNSTLKLTINTNTVTVKTDNKGIFTYKTKATKAGTNKVTASYEENLVHLSTSTTKTFNVIMETKIILNKITTTQYKDNIIIKGEFTNKAGNIIKNTNLKLTFNGKAHTLKTNTKGVFNKTIKTSKVGKNNVTITFAGNNNYKTSTNKTTFTVTKRTTKITVTSIKQKTYNDTVTITGKLTDKTGTILKNTAIKVTVNGKTYTVKTNSKGVYTKKVAATKVGTNNITVTYKGNTYYKAVTKKTTFKTVKRATRITVNKIKATKKGSKVTITGKLTNNKNVILKNTKIKITVNGKAVTVKTNSKGVYTYKYTTSKKGTNKVSISYSGNANYKTTSAKTSFSVK